ncbi:MAG TPA: exodeoxyribonuclease VII small subunit [Gammaproteobacteria bacterium]|nr:exodeoxyribonuclease VII small subunit [Gammaproteobacteria bacterium]
MSQSRKSAQQPATPGQFEATLQELKTLVTRMEQGQQPLETAVDDFEKGMALVKNCEQALQQAAQRIEKVMEEHGELQVESFTTPAPERSS